MKRSTDRILVSHVSDLHFGEVLANSGRGLPLQRPHHLAKCLELRAGINLALDEADAPDDADLRVIASGDLSVSGTDRQLAVAHAFIRSEVSISRLPAPYGVMGLDVAASALGAIPGNHDHWGGNRTTLTPFNGNLFDDQFRFTPWVKSWPSQQNDFELDVFGVDTNSGWDPQLSNGLRRVRGGALAQGRISDPQFIELEKLLAASASKRTPTVRAIVCHHSVSYQGGRAGKLALEAASRDRLLDLAGVHRVAAILTGHTHDSHHHTAQRRDSTGRYWTVTELRCASTVGWPEISSDESSFLFNRITRDAGGWAWNVWRFGWDGSGYACSAQSPWRTFSGAF